MSMMGLMGFAPFIIYFIVPLFAFAYIFLKWRSYRDGLPQDPELGKKVILYYFKTISFHLILISLTLIFSNLLKGDFKDNFLSGIGILIGSSIIYTIHIFIINKIFNNTQTYFVSRFYNGFNFVLVGLIGMTGIIVTTTLLVKGKFVDLQLPISALIIYGTAWVWLGSTFIKKK